MGARRWTDAERAWLRANYGPVGIRGIAVAFEREFGFARSRQAICIQAHKLGLHVTKVPRTTRGGAERRIRWAHEPEMSAWMLEHDTGSIPSTIEGFAKEFGFRPSRSQVSTFRAQHGTGSRRGCGNHWSGIPIGTVRDTGKGYSVVKVRDRPDVPGSKDNWVPEHHLAYIKAHGSIPEGCVVMAADGDAHDVDPGNLVAVPRELVGILNQGPKWHDRESLLAAMAIAKTKKVVRDLEFATPRKCAVCGREFVPDEAKRHAWKQETCEKCLAKGKKARGRQEKSLRCVSKCDIINTATEARGLCRTGRV